MGEPEKESDLSRLVKVVPCMLHHGVHGVRISNMCSQQISLKNQTDIALAHSNLLRGLAAEGRRAEG